MWGIACVSPSRNRPRASIGFRLTLANAALLLATVAVAVGVLYWATLDSFDDHIESRVHTEISELVTMYARDGSAEVTSEIRRRVDSPHGRYSVYLFQEQRGGRIAGNLEAWPEGVGDESQGHDVVIDSQHRGARSVRRLLVSSRSVGEDRLLVGRDVTARSAFERSLRVGSLAALGVGVLLTIGAGLAMSRNLLGRVQAMNRTIVGIREGGTDAQVPVTARGDEFDQLAAQFNELVDENRRLVERTREVTNNIAHDLRTPLARMRRTIEQAIADGDGRTGESGDGGSARGETLQSMLTETDGLLETFNGLLQLAQVESGALRDTMEDVLLEDIARAAIELYEPTAEDAGLELVASLEPGLTVRANRHLVSQALTNLIDNAIKYGAGGGTIEVSTRADDGTACLTVSDHGPGVPEKERDRVLERFVRLDSSRSKPGTGLGLSFVQAVADLHDAELTLADTSPGLRVTLAFART